MNNIHLFNIIAFDNIDMDSNQVSEHIDVQQANGYAVQVYWSGTTPEGSFDLEGSNDNSNFTSILDVPIEINEDTGSFMINVEAAFYGFIRLKYNFTSGSGNLTASVNAQQQ